MAHPARYLAMIPLLAAGCIPIFEQTSDDTGEPADDDPMYGEIDVGRPIVAVRTVSLGLAEVTAAQGPAMSVVHVRLTVANRFDELPWRVDAVNASLSVPGHAESAVRFINTDIATVPITRVEKGEVRIIDFYFPYPEGFDDAVQTSPLQFRTKITTPQRDFAWYARVGPAGLTEPAATPAPGWARYWWADPTYPWPAFRRRPGRATRQVPAEVRVTRPPRWPAAGERGGFAIRNRSSRGLTEIRLSPVVERAWEASLIAPMPRGGDQAVAPIACTYYDVLFVDDGDRRCIQPMVQLCFGNETWLIDDETLASCRWER